MSYTVKSIRLKVSMLAGFVLFSQLLFSQDKWADVNKWLEDNIESLGGRAVLMINKDGKIVYNNSENNLSEKQKRIGKYIAKRRGKDEDEVLQDFDENTRMPIASCSKWLSAALVMSFVDEGKLQLDDTHLIGIKQIGVAASITSGEDVKEGQQTRSTIREKMKERKQDGINSSKNKWGSMDAAIDSIAMQPMEGEPGKTFHYGNAGLQIAAAIVEKISGKDFKTLFAERIAAPCEMINTDYGENAVPLAAGSARSTPTDYMHFLTMILNKGMYNGKRVLSEASIDEMQKNRVKDANVIYSPAEAGNWGYGFGEWVMEGPLLTSPEGGGTLSDGVTSPGLFGSFPWVDNKRGYAGFLFVLNIHSKGRNEKYKALKVMVAKALEQ